MRHVAKLKYSINKQESPAADDIRATRIIAAKNEPTEPVAGRQIPSELFATHYDIVRMRQLADQI